MPIHLQCRNRFQTYSSNGSPWPAEVVQAHRGLQAGFQASRAALISMMSDAIHLGTIFPPSKIYHDPVVEALRRQASKSLPPAFIREINEANFYPC